MSLGQKPWSQTGNWKFRQPLAAICLMLLLSCGRTLPLFQVASLAGATVELRKFEGRWFDPDGNLIAVVTNREESRFSVRLPAQLKLRDARVQNGKLAFHVYPVGKTRASALLRFLRFVGEDKVVMEEEGLASFMMLVPPDNKPLCVLRPTTSELFALARDPSTMLLVRKDVREAVDFARRAYDDAWNWLAGVL